VDLVIQENKRMQKLILVSIFFGLIVSGCHTAKQTQHVVKDTVTTQSPAVQLKPVDSTEILKQQLGNAINAPLNFTTFYGKAKLNYSSPDESENATVYIKMQKDSVIWVSITGPLNIEVVRVLITPDSVKILNKLKGSLQLSSIAHLQQITQLPLTFNDFQNIILGKPVIVSNNDVNYQFKKDSITVTSTGNLLTYIYSFTKDNFQLAQSNLQAANNTTVSGANIFYNDYRQVSDISFSASRDIAIQGASPANLQLNFKEYNFNQPQTFLFTVSKNYTIKYE